MQEKIKIGIVGGAGFAAGELIRILLNHPNVTIQFISSSSQAGKKVSVIHPDLEGDCDLQFTSSWDHDVDLMFLCRGHGESLKFLQENNVSRQVRIIDLGHDFRLNKNARAFGRHFVYGLSEINREEIRQADAIANPGCFATGIQLALAPLAKYIKDDIHINSITGSTGAGQNLSVTSLYSWRSNNVSTYKVFDHQHLDEIRETLTKISPSFNSEMLMVPFRGSFTRGIFSTIYTRIDLSGEEVREMYKSFYETHPFVHTNGSDLHIKKVVNSNNAFISIKKIQDKIFIESVIDNLLKGASGQAVQNMNLMFGLEETTGLRFKTSAY